MLRKVVIGSGLAAVLIPTVGAATPIPEAKGPSPPPPMRPSELPIYEAPHADYAEKLEADGKENKTSYIRSALQTPVTAVRETFETGVAHTSSLKHRITDNYHEFKDRSDWIIQYLREEDNKQTRYGAVAMGGLTGFIFGLRGGFIRRIFYAGLGTTAMGYVCFPEETKQIMNENGTLAKQYINIAYNFLYGVKPGDPQLEVKFPELSIPKDMSELVDMTVSLASTVKQAVMPPPAKESDEKVAEKKE
ncbi:MICOS complex subunit MIC27 [Colias croceus]|uniref:MICOS complex subunit MIC27 n=1 Tax=Colias crocea TaxID=72248 RepID=UPI001E27CFF6|nr:MICOS complex subunit MIC27 [Colias croceus]XP_045504577.1 MICOS complex subunit MIC27 [Colias croceus]